MKKLRLEIDALKVEGFGTATAKENEKGTVRAHGPYTTTCNTEEIGCSGWQSCGYTWCTCDNGNTCNIFC